MKITKAQMRRYECTNCGRKSMHTANHTESIYPECRGCDKPTEHKYLEDVKVVTLSTTKPLSQQFEPSDWHKVAQAIGRITKADRGRRVYLTSEGAQVESLEQMKRRARGQGE